MRGARVDLRTTDQRPDRAHLVHLGQDGRSPCLGRAGQARRREPRGGCRYEPAPDRLIEPSRRDLQTQVEDPYGMGTLMTWIVVQVVSPGACCQTVRVPPCTARASVVPPEPGARAVVPEGSAGSGSQEDPPGAMLWLWRPVVMIAVVPPGPNDAEVTVAPWRASGGDTVQWLPSADQAASRLVPGPEPAVSSAVMPCPARVSRTTVTRWPARPAGRAGPAACQVPSPAVKMPAVPGRAQVPASTGIPAGV